MNHEPSIRVRFAGLFCESEPVLRGFIGSVMAQLQDREDMVQEVALILWRKFDRYDSTRAFAPWALGIAARRMKEEARKKARRPFLLPPDRISEMALAFEATAPESGDEEIALAACLEDLPAESSNLMRRRYYERCDVETLARESAQSTMALSIAVPPASQAGWLHPGATPGKTHTSGDS